MLIRSPLQPYLPEWTITIPSTSSGSKKKKKSKAQQEAGEAGKASAPTGLQLASEKGFPRLCLPTHFASQKELVRDQDHLPTSRKTGQEER